MPRYFFHVRGPDGGFAQDREGQELPHLAAAKEEAANIHREMTGEQLLHGGAYGDRAIEIADGTGKTLLVVTAKDVLLQGGQMRDFPDDVTHSAPKGPKRAAEENFVSDEE